VGSSGFTVKTAIIIGIVALCGDARPLSAYDASLNETFDPIIFQPRQPRQHPTSSPPDTSPICQCPQCPYCFIENCPRDHINLGQSPNHSLPAVWASCVSTEVTAVSARTIPNCKKLTRSCAAPNPSALLPLQNTSFSFSSVIYSPQSCLVRFLERVVALTVSPYRSRIPRSAWLWWVCQLEENHLLLKRVCYLSSLQYLFLRYTAERTFADMFI